MLLRITSRPIRTVLRWQLYAALLFALVFGWWRGPNGAYSALLGAWVSLCAGWVYGLIVSRASASANGATTIRTLLRAEASKLILIVLQLGLILSAYKSIVLPGFFVTFAMTVLIFGMAFFVQD